MIKKFITLLLAFILIFSLTACNKSTVKQNNEENKTVAENNEEIEETEETEEKEVKEQNNEENKTVATERIIVDHAGNEVVLPEKIERIVIDQIPILSTYMAYHGGSAPYIVGYAGSLKEVISNTVLSEIAPELLDADTTVHAQSDLNIEELVKLKPDVIFYNAANKEHKEVLEKTGIPCVGFATIMGDSPADPISRLSEWMDLLEKVFDEPQKTKEFTEYGNEIVNEIAKKIDTIDKDKRPSAMILFKYVNGVPMVSGKGVFGDFWLQRLGVENVAQEVKGFGQVSFEQIQKFNPDILFLNGPGLSPLTSKQVIENNVEGADFSGLNAVKEKRVYNTLLGMWNWFTPNPDAPLVYAWLAKCTYPEVFEDYPLNEKIKEYYKMWYNYELTDEQVEDMFNI